MPDMLTRNLIETMMVGTVTIITVLVVAFALGAVVAFYYGRRHP